MAGAALDAVVGALAEKGAQVSTVVGYIANAVVVAGTTLFASIAALPAGTLTLLEAGCSYVDSLTIANVRIRLSVD
jgi:hypothetical protein